MREFEFIHADEDLLPILEIAAKMGFIIRQDSPSASPEANILDMCHNSLPRSGVFMLFRPDWIFGDPIFNKIAHGYYKGKFSQQPATNNVSLTLYFGGERKDGLNNLLGSGFLSRDINWYRLSDHTVHPAPPDVRIAFNEMRKAIDTGERIRGGKHDFAVLPGALEKLQKGSALPPFDYLVWPSSS